MGDAGFPSDINAHPHVSADGDFALAHNGIIENYQTIRERLTRQGYTFVRVRPTPRRWCI
ncbi:MAG: hypothetical protein R2834_22950 [Rhodothermales bacterium]